MSSRWKLVLFSAITGMLFPIFGSWEDNGNDFSFTYFLGNEAISFWLLNPGVTFGLAFAAFAGIVQGKGRKIILLSLIVPGMLFLSIHILFYFICFAAGPPVILSFAALVFMILIPGFAIVFFLSKFGLIRMSRKVFLLSFFSGPVSLLIGMLADLFGFTSGMEQELKVIVFVWHIGMSVALRNHS